MLIRCLGSLLDDELDASVAAKLLALFCLASASALAERASVRFNSIGASYRLLQRSVISMSGWFYFECLWYNSPWTIGLFYQKL